MKLIVGLGNPGTKYARTRHNAGAWAVEAIADAYGFSSWTKKYDALFCEGRVEGQKIAALLPQTFMNLSGASVRAAASALHVDLPSIVVFHDELDVVAGKVKAKLGGGAGGHNGLKSIDGLLGKDYHRIRIGIGHPGHAALVSDYVLSPPTPEEREAIDRVCGALVKALPAMLGEKIDTALYLNQVGLVLSPPKITPHPSSSPHPDLPPQGGKEKQRLLTPQRSEGQSTASSSSLMGETDSFIPSPSTGEGVGGGVTNGGGVTKLLSQFARSLRTNMTPHERMLWKYLRHEQMGVKFRRQHPMDNYIVDFVCLEKKLIIELDGGQHFEDKVKEKDENRTAFLEKTGHQILRFSNLDISENIEGVLQIIANALETSVSKNKG